MADQNNDNRNVVDLAKRRRHQRTLNGARAEARSKVHRPQHGRGKTKGQTLWQYVQFLLFLAVVAYLMQLCQG